MYFMFTTFLFKFKEIVAEPPKPNVFKRFSNFINAVKELEESQKEEEPEKKTPEGIKIFSAKCYLHIL